MSEEPLQVSAALLRSLANRPRMTATDISVMNGFLTGALPTQAARSRTPTPLPSPYLRHMKHLTGRKWQRSPDRSASLARKRTLGGSSGMPDTIRHFYTEGERAVLTIISGEVKHHGVCDLALDRIAALAGVSRTTAQNAIREARARGHLSVELRERRGQKNLTNLVRITSPEWKTWLKRGPSAAKGIGFKTFHPTKSQDKQDKKEGSSGLNGNHSPCRQRGRGLGVAGRGYTEPHGACGGRGNG